jgi:hypothetical protein
MYHLYNFKVISYLFLLYSEVKERSYFYELPTALPGKNPGAVF